MTGVVDGEVSSWKSVLSGVLQGSVLGPILFLVYIDDLEEAVTGSILKFADDTKLFRKTKEIGDEHKLQDDIDELVRWSEKWQMLFNFGKCKCLHTGPGNTGMNYEMGGTILSKTVKEKDLGVSMNANMKVSEQCRIVASKAPFTLGNLRRQQQTPTSLPIRITGCLRVYTGQRCAEVGVALLSVAACDVRR